MAVIAFDVALFRQQFPQFADAILYPDAMLQMYWDMAICYVNDIAGGYGGFEQQCRQLAINLMTAHLTYIANVIIANNQINGIVNNATIDKVSVGLTPPPIPNQWQWWLNTSPYGQQLLALLQANSVAGFYIRRCPPAFCCL